MIRNGNRESCPGCHALHDDVTTPLPDPGKTVALENRTNFLP